MVAPITLSSSQDSLSA